MLEMWVRFPAEGIPKANYFFCGVIGFFLFIRKYININKIVVVKVVFVHIVEKKVNVFFKWYIVFTSFIVK